MCACHVMSCHTGRRKILITVFEDTLCRIHSIVFLISAIASDFRCPSGFHSSSFLSKMISFRLINLLFTRMIRDPSHLSSRNIRTTLNVYVYTSNADQNVDFVKCRVWNVPHPEDQRWYTVVSLDKLKAKGK